MDFTAIVEIVGKVLDAAGVAVIVIGAIAATVLIRTVLSFSLELEITGRWPWQKASKLAADAPAAN